MATAEPCFCPVRTTYTVSEARSKTSRGFNSVPSNSVSRIAAVLPALSTATVGARVGAGSGSGTCGVNGGSGDGPFDAAAVPGGGGGKTIRGDGCAWALRVGFRERLLATATNMKPRASACEACTLRMTLTIA